MTNYCTNQFLQVRYPNGAGGKFLISCLFWFDNVAHWNPSVQDRQISALDWHQEAWPLQVQKWVKLEPNQPWGLDFYSRRMSRNNQLTIEQFNEFVTTQATDYFFKCWELGLIVVDHWHKRSVPSFFQAARWMEILVSEESLQPFRHCVEEKLFFWDELNRTVISAPDDPALAHDNKTKNNMVKFANPIQIVGYDNYDDFFQKWFLQQEWVFPFVNAKKDPASMLSIDFIDLVNRDRFVSVIARLEKIFNQAVPLDTILESHQIWVARSGLLAWQ